MYDEKPNLLPLSPKPWHLDLMMPIWLVFSRRGCECELGVSSCVWMTGCTWIWGVSVGVNMS